MKNENSQMKYLLKYNNKQKKENSKIEIIKNKK